MNIIWQYQEENFSFEVYDDRPSFPFFEVTQVHENTAVLVDNLDDRTKLIQADAFYSETLNEVTMAIKTADCLPVVLIGEKGMAIAHAGWRGFSQNILIQESFLKLGIKLAIIGPAIQGLSYEVGQEFLETFKEYPEAFNKNDQKLTFDLPLACEIQLKKHYDGIKVINSKIDTFSDLRNNSFRRDKTQRRNYNVLKITGKK